MNLKRVSIENFKSIKESIKIDLKPITLLFGPNSVGKSSILQALQFIKSIILYNDITIFENDDDYQNKRGQFSDIINCHDLSKSLNFQFDFGTFSFYSWMLMFRKTFLHLSFFYLLDRIYRIITIKFSYL